MYKNILLVVGITILFLGLAIHPSIAVQLENIDIISKSHQLLLDDMILETIWDVWDNNKYPLGRSDFGFLGLEDTGLSPPDPIIAAGPEDLVVMTNGAIAFFQKNGTKVFQDEIGGSDGFWGEVGATSTVFDPEVIYDPHSNRFMAMACERAPFSQSYFLLAVSDDMDSNGSWYKYRIDVTDSAGPGIDSPNIGVDYQAVYLSAEFYWVDEKYHVFILEKEPLLNGSDFVMKHMQLNDSHLVGIPVIYGNSTAMFMIEHFENSINTEIRLHAITDPLGTPQRVTYDLDVPSYSPPENPPQKGTYQKIQTFDSRFWSCVWRNGSLWATHHQGSSRVMARWYEIKTNGWPSSGNPELYQSGDIDPGPDIRTFFTSIAPDGYGNAAMCFARSSPDEYISMARCMRLVDDPLGTMGDVVIVKESSAPYNKSRWGDYSGVSCDPSDNTTFWMYGEYTSGNDIWLTWISRCRLINNPPHTPNNPSPQDGAIYVDPNANISWTGGDPNPGDTVTYDIYFGTNSPPPKIVNNQTDTSYDPGTMNFNTMYYWEVVAWDNNNTYSEGPIWNFTTEGPNNPPYEPGDPDPDNNETDVDANYNLSWVGGDPDSGDTLTYDVYFGTISPPPKVSSNQSDTTYAPGTMNHNTIYYWKIVSWDNHGASATGQIWSFTTRDNYPPNNPSDPEPPKGAIDVDIEDVVLSWNCSDPDGDNITYDVYFEADDSTPDVLVSNNQSESWFKLGTMEYNTHYYWKIIAWDEHGYKSEGPVWNFTTMLEPNEPPNTPIIYLENDTIYVYTTDPDGDNVMYIIDWGDGTSTETGFYPSGEIVKLNHGWPPGTYYIRVKARDEHGAESDWSEPYEIVIENNPPDIPIIDGPNSGKPNQNYTFIFNSEDPDGDNVKYYINWGDGDSFTTNFAPSGSDVDISHLWDKQGTYSIIAKAEDVYGAESNWSEFEITIPRTRTTYSMFYWLFERFPLLEKLLFFLI